MTRVIAICERCQQLEKVVSAEREAKRSVLRWSMGLLILPVSLVLVMQLACPTATAQEAAVPVPTLTEVQRLTFQNLSQQLELAQLKAQLAQRDFDAARVEITRLVQSLHVPGYTLDVASLSYRSEPPKELPSVK